MAYGYVTLTELQAALLQRLQDVGAVYTLVPEADAYLTEALQTLNALAPVWNADLALTFAPGDAWRSLNFAGSPRQRTTTNADLYTLMQYHLLEPPSGMVWTGTTQYNAADLSVALQARQDELLQASAANVAAFSLPSPTGSVRTALPDTLLQLRRVRWVPAAPSPVAPYALDREDVLTANAYANGRVQTPAPPDSWYDTSTPPLYFDCSSIPDTPGQWDLLALEAAAAFDPVAPTLLTLPNDWCWVAKWGALADVLANSPEGTDWQRAGYCAQRYARGTKAMAALPWVLDATISNIPCDTISVQEADTYRQNWEQTQPLDDPQVILGGVDLVSLAPNVLPSGSPVSAVLTVVGNAPVPSTLSPQIQLSRDGVDAVLGYAQHLASFKMGGQEFAATLPLYEAFERYCAATNARYAALGILRTPMILEGARGDQLDPRMEVQDA